MTTLMPASRHRRTAVGHFGRAADPRSRPAPSGPDPASAFAQDIRRRAARDGQTPALEGRDPPSRLPPGANAARAVGRQRLSSPVALDPACPRQQLFGRALRRTARPRSRPRCTVTRRLRSGSNGISSMRSRSSRLPAGSATWTSASSIGSPIQSAAGAVVGRVSGRDSERRTRRTVDASPRIPARVGVGHRDEPAGHVDRSHVHAVLRQRAGLVGADHRGRSQCLDAREVTHERVPPRHSPRAPWPSPASPSEAIPPARSRR